MSMSESLTRGDPNSTEPIFSEETVKKMEKRVYWAIISVLFGICFAFFGMNPLLMFFSILFIGFLNPDDRLKRSADYGGKKDPY